MCIRDSRWTAPLFALFFVISGAELELSVFSDISIVIIGIVYIIFRCIGKYLGAWSSAKAVSYTHLDVYKRQSLIGEAKIKR